MRIVVLGSAAGGGYPQWNCGCDVCARAWRGDPTATPRTQSSIAVSADGQRWLLINASPDLRRQILATPALHPHVGTRRRMRRGSPISSVLLTNADVDHVGGLINLRESHRFSLQGSRRVLDALADNPIFGVLRPDLVPRTPLDFDEEHDPADALGVGLGLRVTIFPVPGKVALYMEDPDSGADLGTREGDTVGVRIRDARGGPPAYYIPGCARVDDAVSRRLQGAAVVLFDGTLYRDDELIAAGLGDKTGTRMGHISVDGPDGSLAALRDIDVKRRIYVHLNNSNPLLLSDSPERRHVEREGWEVAYDGMELEL